MLSVVTDGKDGRGFTIEKVVQMFFSFNAMAAKITKKKWSVLTGKILLGIFFITLDYRSILCMGK